MKRAALSLLLCCLAAGLATASEPITIGETVKIQSEILGEERTILISTPNDYSRSQEAYPVLYMTDGDTHLTHTRGTADFLVRNGLIPPLIIVGVANTDRTRDLSPTHASITQDDGTVRELPTSGGAPRFLDFFEQELFPYIDSHYRTRPFRLLAGHSFGGLFALNALFTRPQMFGAVLAVSPSLRWDDELPLRQAKTFFAEGGQGNDLNSTLFVAMANEEQGDPRPHRLDRLEEALQDGAGERFEWQVMRMPDETHGSVVLRAHYWGLRKVFEDYPLPTDPESGGFSGTVADLQRHSASLSGRFGYPFALSEQTVNQAGYQILGRDRVEDAIAIFRYNVELYPEAANVYDSLGEALEQAGRLEEALANYSKAVELADQLADPRLAVFTANRDRARELSQQQNPE